MTPATVRETGTGTCTCTSTGGWCWCRYRLSVLLVLMGALWDPMGSRATPRHSCSAEHNETLIALCWSRCGRGLPERVCGLCDRVRHAFSGRD